MGSRIAVALSKQLNQEKLQNKTDRPGKQSADSESDIVSTNTHTPDTIAQTFHSLLPQTSTHNAFLLQVVIGGINVDFIAKGKEKGLRVIFEK